MAASRTQIISKIDIQYILLVLGGSISLIGAGLLVNLFSGWVTSLAVTSTGEFTQANADAFDRIVLYTNIFGTAFTFILLILGFFAVYKIMKSSKLPTSTARFRRAIALLAISLGVTIYVAFRYLEFATVDTPAIPDSVIFVVPGLLFAGSWFIAGWLTPPPKKRKRT